MHKSMPKKKRSHKKKELPAFKPSAYMRARKPELFSDTLPLPVPKLEKKRLEYELETLTSRKQEQEFEEFCRRLVQLEICPNIKPQTGPTGGGDSKVDAATYPVDAGIGDRTWWGSPATPSDGDWAFAFSCKKSWTSKAREDLEKIAGLTRDFQKVYFITSRFARDKDRARLEDELSTKHGFDVHILDRTWIANVVIEHGREHIAFEALGIDTGMVTSRSSGPRDTARQKELDDLLDRLSRPEEYRGVDYTLAQDYCRAAILSRGLERPRHEIDGLFERAMSIAQKHGYHGQILRIGYDYSWTTLWWFDDATKQEDLYGKIEKCIASTTNADDCRLLGTLWRLLHGSVAHGVLPPEVGRVDERLSVIKSKLGQLANDSTRPNNALQAKTENLLLDLHTAVAEPARVGSIFEELKNCLKNAKTLGTYPAMDLVRFIRDSGEFYGELPGYNSLFEAACTVARERAGETEEGRLLFERGLQLAGRGRAEDVLRFMGKARIKLYKEETMREGIRATLTCAAAYSSMGLFWAARMDAVTAAHATLRSAEMMDEYPREGLDAATKMGWCELSLGRVVPFLAWRQIAWTLIARMSAMRINCAKYEETLAVQQGVLGCLFLNMDAATARSYSRILENMDNLGLPIERMALLYAMGEYATVRDEWPRKGGEAEREIREFFKLWKEQPAAEECPGHLTPATEGYLELSTTLFGVRFSVETQNQFGAILLAENILGVLEATLALARWEHLAFIVDHVKIRISVDESGQAPPGVLPPSPSAPDTLTLTWSPELLDWMNRGSRQAAIEHLKQIFFMVLLITTIDPLPDLEEEFSRWMEEDAPTRAFGTSPISIAMSDIVGETLYDLAYWCKAPTSPKV